VDETQGFLRAPWAKCGRVSRAILKKARSVEHPISRVSKSLPFVEIESASSLGTLPCDDNNVSVLEGNRSQLPVLFIFLITSDARAETKVMLRYHVGCPAMDAKQQHSLTANASP
jgi:hypothetical protein